MIQFGKTFLLDQKEDMYDVMTVMQINKADNIIKINSDTGGMHFIKVKNVSAISGAISADRSNFTTSDRSNFTTS